jgi:hypothetical protein
VVFEVPYNNCINETWGKIGAEKGEIVFSASPEEMYQIIKKHA